MPKIQASTMMMRLLLRSRGAMMVIRMRAMVLEAAESVVVLIKLKMYGDAVYIGHFSVKKNRKITFCPEAVSKIKVFRC